uniref:BTB domain-containing protein n=1 Tax=Oryza barthii TaxID=65489 RepID=A0A0D3HDW3_9ORYZ
MVLYSLCIYAFPSKHCPACLPAMSCSAIVTGYHLLKIDGYSLTKVTPTGTAIKSTPFTVGGYRWRIYYYPNGEFVGSADYISFSLSLDEMGGYSTWGFPKFIKTEDFEKSDYLRHDSFTVRCDMVVVRKIRAEKRKTRAHLAETFVSVPPSDMNRQLGDLLESGKGADVVFEVAGERFAAHRCVLAARSPVFGAELYGLMKEGDAAVVVRVEGVEARVFKLLLRFVYTDSLPEIEEER